MYLRDLWHRVHVRHAVPNVQSCDRCYDRQHLLQEKYKIILTSETADLRQILKDHSTYLNKTLGKYGLVKSGERQHYNACIHIQ